MAKKRRPYEPLVAPPAPSRADVEERLVAVVNGQLSRNEADRWAMQWVAADDAAVEDQVVWAGLGMLAGIDTQDLGGQFLHDNEQLAGWLNDFRRACAQSPRSGA